MSEDLSASGFLLLESGTLHYKTNARDRKDATGEGTLWLREILHLQGVTGNLEAYTSHSLKATALSWTAKSCSMSYEQRLTQGHHVSRRGPPLLEMP